MGTSLYKAFATYVMQGSFTLLLPATVSTVETVKAAQLLHIHPLRARIYHTLAGSWVAGFHRLDLMSGHYFICITCALASIRFELSGNSESFI